MQDARWPGERVQSHSSTRPACQFPEKVQECGFSLREIDLAHPHDEHEPSRSQAGRQQAEPIAFELLDVVESVLEQLRPKAEQKNLKLLLRLERGLPESVFGDPSRLRQILVNIGSNAVKFTETGHVVFRVKTVDRLDAGVRLRFEIEDSGIGIGAAQQVNLFSPLSQTSSSMPATDGGLGLPICKSLCDLMGGDIGVKSMIASGSTFWFELPLGVEKCPPLRPRYDIGDARVMLVGYDEDEGASIEATLAAGGVREIVQVPDGADLNGKEFAACKPDIVLVNGRRGAPNVSDWARRIGALQPNQAVVVTAPHSATAVLGLTSASADGIDLLGTMANPVPAKKLWTCVALAQMASAHRLLAGSTGPATARPSLADVGKPVAQPADDVAGVIGYLDTKVIDLSTLLETVGQLDRDVARMMIDFVDSLGTNVEQLIAAISRGEVRAARSVAHAMKGATLSLGAHEISSLFSRIQQAIDQGAWAKAGALTAELEPARVRLVDQMGGIRRHFGIG